ncbi:MAG: helix-turn-helix transcriptional regulator [Vulcanimicrobiaceae bacterium]
MPTTVPSCRSREGAAALRARIARGIVVRREQAGMTASRLARRIEVDPSTLRRIEAAEALPNTETLIALAATLGTTVDALFAGEPVAQIAQDRPASADDVQHAALVSTEANVSALILLDDAARQLSLHAQAVYAIGRDTKDDAESLRAVAQVLAIEPAARVSSIADRLTCAGRTAQLLAIDLRRDGQRLAEHARTEIRPGYEAGEAWLRGEAA